MQVYNWKVELEYPVNWKLKKAFFVLPDRPTPHYFIKDTWMRLIDDVMVCVRGENSVLNFMAASREEKKRREIKSIEEKILGFFGLKNVREFYRFMERDDVLRNLLARFRGFGRGGYMALTVYEGVVKAIVQQQISFRIAERVTSAIVERFGEREVWGRTFYDFPKPEIVAKLDVQDLKECGLSSRKAECIIEVSKEAASNDFEKLREMCEDEVFEYLTSFKGIGRWTAELVMCMCLDFNVTPADDLGIRRAVSNLFFGGEMQSAEKIREFARNRFGCYTRDVVFYLFLFDRLRNL